LNKEALEWYERGLQLNPFFGGNHFRFGGFLYFEMGEYEKAESFIDHHQAGKTRIADTDAYCAATYYYLQQYDKMQTYWNAYLDTYSRLRSKGKPFTDQDAIEWLLKLNPHRYGSKLEGFLQAISKGSFQKFPIPSTTTSDIDNLLQYHFLKDANSWKLSFDGYMVQAPEVKGFYDIEKMLTQPHQLFHCAELMGSTLNSQGEKLIDEKARKKYQEKILDLQSDLEEAEKLSDFARVEKLQEEYDQLIAHLSQSLNLKGRIKETGSTVEKARSAVTWRIRNAIARIEQCHPMLGAHLSNAIKTGTLCSYKPDRSIPWITS
jgi:tetratricopeptide (TPR) repeat protein